MASSSHNLAAPGTPGRVCGTTGLHVCLDAQRFIKLNAVVGIVFLLLGGIAALGQWPATLLQRWAAEPLLSPLLPTLRIPKQLKPSFQAMQWPGATSLVTLWRWWSLFSARPSPPMTR